MKYILISILLLAYATAEMHPVNSEIVAEIKRTATWTPMEPEDNPFAFVPVETIKAMMGTKLTVPVDTAEDLGFTPNDEFDARKKWGSKVHPIRNQGQCGSCWAFGATEALSDRFAIEKNVDVVLSPQHLVSCDKGNYGCQGGYLGKAWSFMQKTGVVSDKCYPYTSGTSGQTGSCKSSCQDGSAFKPYKAGSYSEGGSVTKTMQSLQQEGPVEAAFQVYQDFMSYKSGVYEHKTGGLLGGHAIKCIGWGTEGGVDYWLMANSWGTSWGDSGFFKIKRHDCSVDNDMTWALADKSAMEATE